MNYLYCTADQFIDQFLPLFESISHCELILANRPDVDQCSVLARIKTARAEIERLSSKKRIEAIEEIEEIETEEVEETEKIEIDPATVATAALTPEPLPKETPRPARRELNGNHWLEKAKKYLQMNGPATTQVIAKETGINSIRDVKLLNSALHSSYKRGQIFHAGSLKNSTGRPLVIWAVTK